MDTHSGIYILLDLIRHLPHWSLLENLTSPPQEAEEDEERDFADSKKKKKGTARHAKDLKDERGVLFEFDTYVRT